jgi:hypothetical protein
MNLTYFSPKVEKRPSGVDGTGLFARRPISKGETVVVKGGYVMTQAERDAVSQSLGPAEIQIGDDLFIGPRTASERDGGMMHLNHSCEPNVGIRGEITFVAMRDIRSDEELSFDYAMTDDEPDIDMQCNCGTPDCRRVITGLDWRRPDLQRRYEGYFSAYLQHKIATSTAR